MLKWITCDKFKTQPREFRTGLNVVLGSSGGSNAIGKSTFLLILDFVFGGDNYAKSAKDVIAHIDHHTINFEFEFDSTPFFFSRSNLDRYVSLDAARRDRSLSANKAQLRTACGAGLWVLE